MQIDQITRRKPGSWVFVCKAAGQGVYETFSETVAAKVNRAKYDAVPIGEYLANINDKIRREQK